MIGDGAYDFGDPKADGYRDRLVERADDRCEVCHMRGLHKLDCPNR